MRVTFAHDQSIDDPLRIARLRICATVEVLREAWGVSVKKRRRLAAQPYINKQQTFGNQTSPISGSWTKWSQKHHRSLRELTFFRLMERRLIGDMKFERIQTNPSSCVDIRPQIQKVDPVLAKLELTVDFSTRSAG